MRFRKNKKRIDPRYFLHETANRDELDERMSIPDDVVQKCMQLHQIINKSIEDREMDEPSYGAHGKDPDVYYDRPDMDVVDDYNAQEDAKKQYKEQRCASTLQRYKELKR
jgi:hypothetical protein|tara:strand:- start:409 stop:738 length:330 start_codon:yes stop_codon:yes gene_type:complete